MGSCGTAVTILLKELVGHGLATHNEHDSAVLGTLASLLGGSSPKLAMGFTLCAANLNGYSNACIWRFTLNSPSIAAPSSNTRPLFKFTSMNSGVSLLDRDLQNFGPKAKNRRLFLLVPMCVCQAVTLKADSQKR